MNDIIQRKQMLIRLYDSIKKNEDAVIEALKTDFNKNSFDAYATEIGMVYHEITYFLKNLSKLAQPKKVRTGIMNFKSYGVIYPQSYGKVLIIAPWNYPFQLSMCPLVGAIAAGNSAVLKPSIKTKATFNIIEKIILESHLPVTVTSRRDILQQKYDYIFFTGGVQTGREVMLAAANHLTPVTLELGGKSPVIIDSSADLALAAKRIAWGKFLNAGQTCIAPDYVFVPQNLADTFKKLLIQQIKLQYYVDDKLSTDFTNLINMQKADEIRDLLNKSKEDIVFGGEFNGLTLQPTILNATTASLFMQDEIFAPVLPIITYESIIEPLEFIKSRPSPLALYYFGKKSNFKRDNFAQLSFGGGCINDVIMHVTERKLPFGGVGQSGMGSYHASKSFDTFTHYASVLVKGKLEFNARYAPHSKTDIKLLKKISK